MDRGAVRRVEAAKYVGRVQPCRSLGGVGEAEIVLGFAPCAGVLELRAGSARLCPAADEGERAALGVVTVDSTGRGRGTDLIDAVVHRAAQCQRTLTRRLRGDFLQRCGK